MQPTRVHATRYQCHSISRAYFDVRANHAPGHTREGGLPKLPCAKLQLDNLFLQWLSMPECQKLVRGAKHIKVQTAPHRPNTTAGMVADRGCPSRQGAAAPVPWPDRHITQRASAAAALFQSKHGTKCTTTIRNNFVVCQRVLMVYVLWLLV